MEETPVTDYTKEIQKRRTFAIISHPDAGKTTLTEKFLLYGGAINLAGSVKGKATARLLHSLLIGKIVGFFEYALDFKLFKPVLVHISQSIHSFLFTLGLAA